MASVEEFPIAILFNECLQKYRELCLKLTSNNSKLQQGTFTSQLSDEYGRLRVWGRNSGADRTGRSSLDDILRLDTSLRSIVLDLLAVLIEDLGRGVGVPFGQIQQPEPFDDSISESTESGSSGDDTSIVANNPRKVPIKSIISAIFEDISSLYRVSILLRRPLIKDKYIRSATTDTHLSSYLFWEKQHVIEKTTQWTKDIARIKGCSSVTIVNQDDPLIVRLAFANCRRREQLAYWQRHPDRPSLHVTPTSIMPFQEMKPSQGARWESRSQPTKDNSKQTKKTSGHTVATSNKTQESFSTIAASALAEEATIFSRTKTVYTPSTKGGSTTLRVPDLPKFSNGALTFDCPYCFAKLDPITMQKRAAWKRHVFRDLQPYTCTFSHCPNGEKLYVTRHDWIYHEMQMHRRQWVCTVGCNLNFADKVLLQTHLQDRHPEMFDGLQLPVLVDICERPNNMDTETECPLCFDVFSLEVLYSHLAAHLEELALFLLPLNPNDSPDDGNSDSAKPVLQNETQQDFDNLSSLGPYSVTEAPEPHTQDPQTFKLLLKQDEIALDVDENERNPSILSSGTWTTLESGEKLGPEDGWEISADERHQCYLIFEAIDSGDRGFVARRDFVNYLRDFGNRDTLRKIWQSTGHHGNSSIGQDEFAIAMHLLEINQENKSEAETYGVRDGILKRDSSQHITGTPGVAERLYSSFKVHKSSDFKPGHVFKVLWSEPQGTVVSAATDVTNFTLGETNLGGISEKVYCHIRTFLIVATSKTHSTCIPILTYNHTGIVRPGVGRDHHAIIYSGKSAPQPLPGEPEFLRSPIQVILKTPGGKLAKESLINYTKIYTVEHNVKTKFIGLIALSSMKIFMSNFNATWGTETNRKFS